MQKNFNRVMNAGLDGFDPKTARSIRIIDLTTVIIATALMVAILVMLQQDDYYWQKSAGRNAILLAALLPALIAERLINAPARPFWSDFGVM
jgi:hypothetical protein